MGILNDDAVLIEPGKNSGDPTMVTVNCPDESGLGSTLCRIILEFGLSITKAGIKVLTFVFFGEYTLFCRLRIFEIRFNYVNYCVINSNLLMIVKKNGVC